MVSLTLIKIAMFGASRFSWTNPETFPLIVPRSQNDFLQEGSHASDFPVANGAVDKTQH
jgi:hypothetical protein